MKTKKQKMATKENKKAPEASAAAAPAKEKEKKPAQPKAKNGNRRVYTNPPGEGTIGAAVLKAMQAKGATRESVLTAVKKQFPKSKFDGNHLSWYRNRFAQDLGIKVELKTL